MHDIAKYYMLAGEYQHKEEQTSTQTSNENIPYLYEMKRKIRIIDNIEFIASQGGII